MGSEIPSFTNLAILKTSVSGSPKDHPFFRSDKDAAVKDSVKHPVEINCDAKQVHQSKYAPHIIQEWTGSGHATEGWHFKGRGWAALPGSRIKKVERKYPMMVRHYGVLDDHQHITLRRKRPPQNALISAFRPEIFIKKVVSLKLVPKHQ